MPDDLTPNGLPISSLSLNGRVEQLPQLPAPAVVAVAVAVTVSAHERSASFTDYEKAWRNTQLLRACLLMTSVASEDCESLKMLRYVLKSTTVSIQKFATAGA